MVMTLIRTTLPPYLVDKALDEVRPFLIADGGNVEVAAVDLTHLYGSFAGSSHDYDADEELPPLTPYLVDKALDEVRPYLIADGGNVEVAAVQDGVVMLRLQGACGTCPSSTATMKMGIERSLRVSCFVPVVTSGIFAGTNAECVGQNWLLSQAWFHMLLACGSL